MKIKFTIKIFDNSTTHLIRVGSHLNYKTFCLFVFEFNEPLTVNNTFTELATNATMTLHTVIIPTIEVQDALSPKWCAGDPITIQRNPSWDSVDYILNTETPRRMMKAEVITFVLDAEWKVKVDSYEVLKWHHLDLDSWCCDLQGSLVAEDIM